MLFMNLDQQVLRAHGDADLCAQCESQTCTRQKRVIAR